MDTQQVETIDSVTQWADATFGQATIQAMFERACKEMQELQLAMQYADGPIIAMEAADVCICLYRMIGTLDRMALDKKMAINRARTWKLDGNGCAQHVKDQKEQQ